MSNFIQTISPTPFGYYDANPAFQRDADSMVIYVLRKMGISFLSIELTKKDIYACFEEATRMFNSWIIEYQTISNLSNLLGIPTGSWDSTTGQNTINLINNYIAPNLEFLDRLAEPYANIIGYGSTQNSFSGSIDMVLGKQDYDLYTDLKLEDGSSLYSLLSSSNPGGKMRIFEVFHFAPLQYLFNSSFGSNFPGAEGVQGIGIPGGYFNSDTRFSILPLFGDMLRSSLMETAMRVRRSHYNYKISGRNIRFLPVPSTIIPGINDKVWIRVGFSANPNSGLFIDNVSGSLEAGASGFSGQFYGASNPANIPMGLVNYSTLNQWSKNWITRCTFILCLQTLGRIRRKISRVPIPGAELELDGSAIMSEAIEGEKLLLEELKGKLESLSYSKLQEMETQMSENLLNQLKNLPIPPTHNIRTF